MIALWLALQATAFAAPPVLDLAGEPYTGGVPGPVPEVPWWEGFDAPRLDTLVQEGLQGNFDAQTAWARVEQADAVARQAFSVLLPQATFDVSVNTQPSSAVGFQFGIQPGTPGQPARPDLFHTASGLFNVQWELDLFGESVLAWRASRFDAEAAAGDAWATQVALSTRIAEAWLDVVAADARVDVLQAQIEAQEDLLELLQLRYEQGQSNALDVLQQRQSVAASRSQLPTARLIQRTRAQQLAVLVGRRPAAMPTELGDLPEPQPLPPTGLPGDLVENRPDVRAAWERVRAAGARRMSAARALLPSVRLTANAGVQAVFFDEMRDQDVWGAGGVLSVPLFLGGRGRANLQAARAGEDIAVLTYNQTLLTALGEVESALASEEERAAQYQAVVEQLAAARDAWDVARERYLAGLDTYLSVLTAWNAYQQAELALIQAHRDRLGARVQLHDALGAPWAGVDRRGPR